MGEIILSQTTLDTIHAKHAIQGNKNAEFPFNKKKYIIWTCTCK